MKTMKMLVFTTVLIGGIGLSACETRPGQGAAVGAAVERDENLNKCFQRGVEVPCPLK